MSRVWGTLVAVGAAAALTGCGLLDGTATQTPDSTDTSAAVIPAPLQAANGPLVGSETPEPLAVHLEDPDVVQPHFKTPPRGGLLFDFDTGRVLWQRNPTRVLPMASVTKLMTALIVSERLPQDAKVKVTKDALHYPRDGTALGVLPKGRRVGVNALLYGLLLASANDAAIALSQRVSGSMSGFVRTMNAKAQDMHLSCTQFSRPDGYSDVGNHTCAYDLAALGRAVLDSPRLRKIVRHRSAVLPFPIKGGKLFLYNHNPLLKSGYSGTIGLKTGYTRTAGKCLVAAVRRHGHTLGVVLLHSPNIAKQAVKLFDKGFALPEYAAR